MPPLPIATFEPKLPDLVNLLRSMVEIESPTTDKAGIDRLGQFVAQRLEDLGAEVHTFRQEKAGDHWLGVWGEGPGGILMLAHLDTVHPRGSLERMPWKEAGGRLHGPGVLDMKAGVAMALTAIAGLRYADMMPERRISLLCTSDEEMGSHTSRPIIERSAQEHDLVLCLEPALTDGSLKTWRKGTGAFRLETRGRSAHAGTNPEQGVNAILEMAHQIQRVTGLSDEAAGTTITVGTIRGGTRANVVPEACLAAVDIRVMTMEEQTRLERAFAALQPTLPGAKVRMSGAWNRPPMLRTSQMAETFGQAQRIGAQLGLSLTEGGTGGGSDANFVAPLGVPVLDGLGALGNGAHTLDEHVHRHSLVERTALLAALLTEWPLA